MSSGRGLGAVPPKEYCYDAGVTAERSMVRNLPAICPFGRYELLGRLAVGGMAEIYLARERPTVAGAEARHLVIKRILQHVADDDVFLRMFLDEARLQMRLRHPSIVHVYEFGEEQGSYYLAMEWVDGVALGKLIRRAREQGNLPPPVVVKIISRIAEALHHAHMATDDDGSSLGIVHRDVSPQNIMVSYDGAVKLLDFGIAKATIHHTKTQEGQVKGKFAYMAPEQCLGEAMDGRADVFALGVCLYEALTGRPLYHRKTQYETMRAVIESQVPSIRKLEPDLPEALDLIVQKALAKHASDRFSSAGEMQMALERWLQSEQHIVAPPHITSVLEGVFGEEIRRGPMVSSTPFGESFKIGERPSLPGSDPPPGLALPPATPSAELISADLISATPALMDLDPLPSQPPPSNRTPLIVGLVVLLLLLGVGGVVAWQSMTPETSPQLGVVTQGVPPTVGGPAESATSGMAMPVPVPTHNPEATPAARGSITFRSDPPGAVVWLGDRQVPGVTPTSLGDIVPDRYETRLELEGYRDWTATVDVQPGREAEISAELRRRRDPSRMVAMMRAQTTGAAGSISINTRPWSKVYVGSRLLGTTPIGRAEVPSGSVTLRIVDRDGNEHRRQANVGAGEDTRLFFDLSGVQ